MPGRPGRPPGAPNKPKSSFVGSADSSVRQIERNTSHSGVVPSLREHIRAGTRTTNSTEQKRKADGGDDSPAKRQRTPDLSEDDQVGGMDDSHDPDPGNAKSGPAGVNDNKKVKPELLPIQERGLGNMAAGIGHQEGRGIERYGILDLPADKQVTVWWFRPYVDRTIAPYHDPGILKLIQDRRKMLRMARLWSAPSFRDTPIRVLDSDKVRHMADGSPLVANFDRKSAALMFAANTSLKDNVWNYCRVSEMDAGILCQQPMARPELKLLHGAPSGGYEQCPPVMFFETMLDPLNPGQPSDAMMKLMSVLSMSLSNPEITSGIWAVSSEHSEVVDRGKKLYNSMRLKHENCKSALYRKYPWSLADDLDPELLDRTMNYRKTSKITPESAGPDHPSIIPLRARTNDPDLTSDERELNDREKQYFTSMIDGSLFSLELFISAYPCLDENGRQHWLQVCGLRFSGLPWACPLTCLNTLKNEGGHIGSDLTIPLKAVIERMCEDLDIERDAANIDNVFNMDADKKLSDIAGEEKMFEAIFRVAHKHGMTDIDVGGRKMCVTDEEEMKLWRQYCEGVQNVRQGHWRLVSEEVFHLTSLSGRLKDGQYPCQKIDSFGQNYSGFTFLSVEMDVLLQRCHERVRANGEYSIKLELSDAPTQEQLDDPNSTWFTEQLREIQHEIGLFDWEDPSITTPRIYHDTDNRMYYFPVGSGSMLYNNGMLFKINCNMRPAWTRKQRHVKESEVGCVSNVARNYMLQPTSVSMLANLYFNLPSNSLDCLWEDDLVMDETYMTENEFDIPPAMHKILMAIREARVEMNERIVNRSKQNIRDTEVNYLCGLVEHPIRDILYNSSNRGDLSKIASMQHFTLIGNIDKTMDRMADGPLLQFSRAAQVLKELKMGDDPNSSSFIDLHGDWMRFTREFDLESTDGGNDTDIAHINIEATAQLMSQYFINKQRLEVNFINQQTIECLHNCMIMIFYGLKWDRCGTVNHIYDGAGCFEIRKYENGKIVTMPMLRKSPGCGADFSTATACMLNNGWGAFMCKSTKLLSFYKDPISWDKLLNKISPLRIHCIMGSAIMTEPTGGFDPNDMSTDEIGTIGVLMELFKEAGGDEMAQNILRILEICGGQPTKGNLALATNTWESSLGMLKKTPKRVNGPIPIPCITTNTAHKVLPESTLNGARAVLIASSSPDTVGVIERHESGSQTNIKMPTSLPDSAEKTSLLGNDPDEGDLRDDDYDSYNNFQKEVEDIGLGLDFLGQDEMSTMKGVDEEMVKNSPIFFWILFKLRKLVAFAGKTMTLHYVQRTYTLHTTTWGIEKAFRGLTVGHWRMHFNKDSFFRNIMASWRTKDLPATWLKALAHCTVMNRCKLPNMSTTCGTPVVDLAAAFNDMIMAILYIPPSMYTILSSIYLWLSTSMLDLNLLIISSFCLYTMGLQENCPLHVLALAANGHDLTDEQARRFELLAEFVVRACCDKGSKHAENAIMTKGHLKPLAEEGTVCVVIEKILGVERDNHVADVKCMMNERNRASESTVFVYPKVKPKFLTQGGDIPSWMEYGEVKLNSGRKQMKLNLRTHDEIVAELFAEQQSEENARKRRDNKNSSGRNGQHSWANTELFWKAAAAGTRLPQEPKHKTDSSTISHPSVQTTGTFYRSVIEQSKKDHCGVTATFLRMCGLSTSNSRYEIFTKIFKTYIDKHGKAFPKTRDWTEKLVPSHDTVDPKFAIGASIVQESNGKFAIETMLGIDIMWFLVAQGLYANEWKRNNDGMCDAVIHTRVMSQAVLVILMLYIHTLMEKAVVPANNGSLPLRGCSPYRAEMTRNLPVVTWDSRLHIDREDMLSTQSRTVENTTVFKIENSEIMVYNHMVKATESTWQPKSLQQVPAFPSESIAHCMGYWHRLHNAIVRFDQQNVIHPYGPECYLPLALSDFLQSFHLKNEPRGVESLAIYMSLGVNPTYCLTQPGIEMPFVSSRYNMMFVLRTIDNGQFKVVSVKPTNNLFGNIFRHLPLAGTRRSFHYQDFSFAMTGGLKRLEDGTVCCRYPRDITGNIDMQDPVEAEIFQEETSEVMAMIPFPVTFWNHFVKIEISGQTLRVFQDKNMKVNERLVHIFPHAHQVTRDLNSGCCLANTDDWFRFNPDIPEVHEDYKVDIVRRDINSDFGMTWRSLGPYESLRDGLVEFHHPELADFLANSETPDGGSCSIPSREWTLFKQMYDNRILRDLDTRHFIYVQECPYSPPTIWVPKPAPDNRYNFWIKTTDGVTLYFNSREHLKWALKTHGKTLISDHDVEMMQHRNHLIRLDTLADPSDMKYYSFIHAYTHDSDKIVARDFEYSDPSFYSDSDTILTCMFMISLKQSTLKSFQLQRENGATVAKGRQAPIDDDIAYVQGQIDQWTSKLSETEQRIQTSVPTQKLTSEWFGPLVDEPLWTISPCKPSQTPRRSTLGLLTRHTSSGQFMSNGHYMVHYLYDGQPHKTRMDFVTASYATITEGRPVWFRLDADRYRDLMHCIPDAYLEDAGLHDGVLANQESIYLRGFYVVGCEEPANILDAKMILLVKIHEKNSSVDKQFQFDNNAEQKAMIYVKIFNDDGELMLNTDASLDHMPASHCVTYLTRITNKIGVCPHGPSPPKRNATRSIFLKK